MPGAEASDIRLLEDAACEAGEVALGFLSSGARQWTKADNSPVTEADMAVDALLRARLSGARPDYGWLSEETADDGARLTRRRVFIVDPIDGTRAFIAGEDGWVISAAVVEDGQPLAGVLFNPLRKEMWSAVAGTGATLNSETLAAGGRLEIAGAHIAGPRSMIEAAGLSDHEAGIRRSSTKSLAYRLAKVAQGVYDAAFATGRSRDWDLAAGVLMVQEAGGRVTDLAGRAISFNGAETRHPPLVAAGVGLHTAILAATRARDHGRGETEAIS